MLEARTFFKDLCLTFKHFLYICGVITFWAYAIYQRNLQCRFRRHYY